MSKFSQFFHKIEGTNNGSEKNKGSEVEELECASRSLDLRGVPDEAEKDFDFRRREARGWVINDLKELADLIGEMKEGGYEIWINSRPYNGKDLIAGSIEVRLKRGDVFALIYEQVFNSSFVRHLENEKTKIRDWHQIIGRAKDEIERKLDTRQKIAA